jgi:hypothetical protein
MNIQDTGASIGCYDSGTTDASWGNIFAVSVSACFLRQPMASTQRLAQSHERVDKRRKLHQTQYVITLVGRLRNILFKW